MDLKQLEKDQLIEIISNINKKLDVLTQKNEQLFKIVSKRQIYDTDADDGAFEKIGSGIDAFFGGGKKKKVTFEEDLE